MKTTILSLLTVFAFTATSAFASERFSPKARDGDGIPNYLDTGDDNDGMLDDYDGNQYGDR